MTATADGRWAIERRRLYLCVPDRPDLERFVGSCLEGGVDVVQLRDKSLPDTETVRIARAVRRICSDFGAPFVLNDRPDLAADAGADGVHVGQDDPDPRAARRLLGADALVGLSTHSPAELDAASDRAVPIDYVSAGPVVPTPTKPGREGTGLAYVSYAAERSPWPVWTTGGVTPDVVPSLVAAGASRFVAVRWLTEADDPKERARWLRRVIDEEIDRAEV